MPKLNSHDASTAHQPFVLILLCAAQFMMVLDFSIVNVALPSMQQDLSFSPQNLQWLISAYSLTFGGFLLLGGRAADLFDHRRVLMLGLGLFMLASLVGGLAQVQWVLISSRAFQGLGAAIVSPTVLTIVLSTFPEDSKRNRALGALGAMAAGGFAVGALLGGLLTDVLGWRWVMFVNVPIAIAIIIFTPLFLHENRALTTTRRIDLAGAVVVTVGLVLLVYTLMQAPEVGLITSATVLRLISAIALLSLFVWIESRVSTPLVPLSIFCQRTLMAANLIAALVSAIGASMVFILTLYMQQILHYSAFATGLAFLPHAIAAIVAAPLSSYLVKRTTAKFTLIIGLILSMIGLLLLTQISVSGTFIHNILPGTILVGLGIVTCFITVTITATAEVKNHDQGLISGLLNTFEQIGSAVGLAVVIAVATTVNSSLTGLQNAAIAGFQAALIVSVGFAALGILITVFAIRHPKNHYAQNKMIGCNNAKN